MAETGTNGNPDSNSVLAGEEILHDGWKIRMAKWLADMRDTMRIQTMTFRDDQRHRDQRYRLQKAQTENAIRAYGKVNDEQLASQPDDMGDINIDSPTTHEHHYPPKQSGMGTLGKVLGTAALVTAAGAAGAGINYWLNRPAPPPENTTIENTQGFLLELVE